MLVQSCSCYPSSSNAKSSFLPQLASFLPLRRLLLAESFPILHPTTPISPRQDICCPLCHLLRPAFLISGRSPEYVRPRLATHQASGPLAQLPGILAPRGRTSVVGCLTNPTGFSVATVAKPPDSPHTSHSHPTSSSSSDQDGALRHPRAGTNAATRFLQSFVNQCICLAWPSRPAIGKCLLSLSTNPRFTCYTRKGRLLLALLFLEPHSFATRFDAHHTLGNLQLT